MMIMHAALTNDMVSFRTFSPTKLAKAGLVLLNLPLREK